MTSKLTSSEYQQLLIKLQEGNILDGVINEPRAFFDTITLDEPYIEVNGHADVFRNGEQFPIRLTHVLFAMARLDADGDPVDAEEIQRVGARFKFHDQYYMNTYSANPYPGTQRGLYVPTVAWGLNPTAASPVVSSGSSAWQFQRPFVLSAQDTIRVDVKLDDIPEQNQFFPVTVSFTGIGMLSRKPYFLTGQILVEDAIRQTISTENYRSDGTEPMLITNMTANIGAQSNSNSALGDIRRLSIGVRQIGNGTNRTWFQGPTNALPDIVPDLIPAVLLGQQSGRAVVHQLPDKGIIWQPGEGIVPQVQNLINAPVGSKVHIGLLGYISVE